MKKFFSLMLLCATILLTSCSSDDDPIAVTGVILDKTTLSIVVGGTATLTATLTPDNAGITEVSWISCDKAIATVSDKGVVTAVAVGKATITVVSVSGGKTASCEVVVTAAPVPVTGVKLDKEALSLNIDEKVTLASVIAPADATNTHVTWATSDSKVATVNATGEVVAVGAGAATITVTTEDGGKTATCVVTVMDRPAFKFYGGKNRKLVYYDGKELKYVGDLKYPDGTVGSGVIKDDFYFLGGSFLGYPFFKNGEVCAKEDKVPVSDYNRLSQMSISGNDIYICGQDKSGSGAYWKNGKKIFTTGGSTLSFICVLGNDVYTVEKATSGSTRISIVYKNSKKIAEVSGRADGLTVYDGKVYMALTVSQKSCLYVYNGTTMVEAASVNGDYFSYFGVGGNVMIAAIENGDNTNLYKNVNWATALSNLEIPTGTKGGFPYLTTVIGEGDDIYTYGSCESSTKDGDEIYGWKNGLNPIRMPADSIDALIHIK